MMDKVVFLTLCLTGFAFLYVHSAPAPETSQNPAMVSETNVAGTSNSDVSADVMTLPDDVIIDALFSNIDSVQDQLEICEEGLREKLYTLKHGGIMRSDIFDYGDDDDDDDDDDDNVSEDEDDDEEKEDSFEDADDSDDDDSDDDDNDELDNNEEEEDNTENNENESSEDTDEINDQNDDDEDDDEVHNEAKDSDEEQNNSSQNQDSSEANDDSSDDDDDDDDDDKENDSHENADDGEMLHESVRKRRSSPSQISTEVSAASKKRARNLAESVVSRLNSRLDYLKQSLVQCYLLYKDLA